MLSDVPMCSAVGVTLTASPVLSTAVYHTTYTYLNTLLDGEVPLVLTSRRTVANTVTAPGELLGGTEAAALATNTYLSTVQLTRTLSDGDQLKVVSTQDVLTRVVITESQQQLQAPASTPTELDLAPTTTEVVKTYLVTYTYYSTYLEGERTVVHSDVAVSTDITTETFLKKPKRTSALRLETTTSVVEPTPTPPEPSPSASPTRAPAPPEDEKLPGIHVVATKTYLTTFTYFTTLLQGSTPSVSTVVSSRTRVVQNVVTESVATSLLHPDYVQRLRSSFRADPALDSSRIVATATLQGGQQMEITAMVDSPANLAALAEASSSSSLLADAEAVASTAATPALASVPTPDKALLSSLVSSAASAIMAQEQEGAPASASANRGSSSPGPGHGDKVITGSTIIFFDESEPADKPSSSSTTAVKTSSHKHHHQHATAEATSKPSRTHRPPTKTHKHKVKPTTAVKEKPSASAALGNTYRTSILSSRTVTPHGATLQPGEQVVVLSRPDGSEAVIPVGPTSSAAEPATNKRPSGEKVGEAAEAGANLGVSDLLQLGSIGINGINALRPVFSAMAGLLSPAKEETPAKQPLVLVHKLPSAPVPHGPPPPGLLAPPAPAPAGLPLKPPPAPGPVSPAPVLEQNPLLSYAGPQPPPAAAAAPPERLVAASSNNPPRNPIYIPVGAGAGSGHPKDALAEESQRVEGNVKLNAVWPDAEQRLRLAQQAQQQHAQDGVVLGRPTLESPLLAGGIPIQPGQVITANSDVIIGKPSVHGPRPPKRPPSPPGPGADLTPIGMRPPPPPPPPQATWPEHDRLPEDTVDHDHLGDHHDQPVPAASNVAEPHDQFGEQIANLLPPPAPPVTPLREDRPSGGPVIPLGHPHHHKTHEILDMSPPANQPAVVHAPSDDVPLRPPPLPQHQLHLQHHLQHYPQHDAQLQHHPVDVIPVLTVVGSHSPASLGLGDFGPSPTQVSVVPQGQTVFLGRPLGQKMNVDQQHLTPDTITVPIILPGNPQVVERASGQPLLVNIQPSQVANVLIPHGSSTALIYSGDTLEHGKKGEYFDDPLPYPDPDTAHSGPVAVGPLGVPKPSSAIRMDVPIPPEGIQVQISAGNAVQGPSVHGPPSHGPSIPLHNEAAPQQHHHGGHHHQKEQPTPSQHHHHHNHHHHPLNNFPNGRPQPHPHAPPPLRGPPPLPDTDNEQDGGGGGPEENDPIESEGGELIQESNARPLRPGQLPVELEVANQAKTTERTPIFIPHAPVLQQHHGHRHYPVPRPQEPFRFERPAESKPMNFDIESPIKSTIIYEQRPDSNRLEPTGPAPPKTAFILPRPSSKPSAGAAKPPPAAVKPSPTPIPLPKPPPPPTTTQAASTTTTSKPDAYGETPPPPPPATASHKPPKSRPDRRPSGPGDRTSHDDQVLGMAPPTPPPPPPSTTTGRPHRRPAHRKPRPPPPYKFEMPPPPADTMQPPTEQPPPPPTSGRPSPPAPSPPASPAEARPFNRPPVLEMAKPLPTISLPGSQAGETVQHEVTWSEPPRRSTTTTSTTTTPAPTTSSTTRRPAAPFIRPIRPFSKPPRPSPSPPREASAATPSIVPTPPQPAQPTAAAPTPLDIAPTTTRGRPPPSNRWTASPIAETIAASEPTLPGVAPSSVSAPLDNFSGKSSVQPTRVYLTRHSGATNRFTRPTTTERFTPSPTRDPASHTRYASPPYRAPPRRPQPVDDAPSPAPTPEPAPAPAPQPTRYITHTETIVLTTTETSVLRGSEGQKPSTQTVVLTSTMTSTRVDTVTETQTLVKPTSVFETVTTTVSHTTTHIHTHTAEPPVLPTVSPGWATSSPKPYPENESIDVHVSSSASGHPAGEEDGEDDGDIITHPQDGEDSIFLVMTDHKPGTVQVHKLPPPAPTLEDEPTNADETNEVKNNAVLLGGVLVASPPGVRPAGPAGVVVDELDPEDEQLAVQCRPECSAARNELCQRQHSLMRCVCRPGFARMFPDQPCKPTYTYSMRLALDRHAGERVRFAEWLSDPTSPRFARLAEATKEGLERVVMQSELRDVAHGVVLQGFAPAGQHDSDHAVVNFYVQLSDNTDELRLKDVFRKSLRATNFSLGGTEVFAAREMLPELDAADFDECEADGDVGDASAAGDGAGAGAAARFHDCSEHARCFNLRGTYTCSCKEGYTDVSENPQFPGRACSAEQVGCEQCHYHGTCYSRGPGERPVCECFQWYTGQNCHINLKVLLIALGTLGAVLALLLVLCCVMACARRHSRRGGRGRPQPPGPPGPPGFLRYRGPSHRDRDHDTRAMIHDTSSEGSVDNLPLPPYVTMHAVHQPMHTMSAKHKKAAAKKVSVPAAHDVSVERVDSPAGTMEQRDRSLTVMIPRAKYRAAPGPAAAPAPGTPAPPLSTFTGEPADPQHKLLAYLDGSGGAACPQRGQHGGQHGVQQGGQQAAPQQAHAAGAPAGPGRKQSSQSAAAAPPAHRKGPAPRKPSSTGALVSAGFEVSATVGRHTSTRPGPHTLDLDEDVSSRDGDDLSSHHPHYHGGDQHHHHQHDQRYDTQRTRVGDRTVSEARSCDETTIQPPTKCIHSHVSNYASSKPSSHSNHNNNDYFFNHQKKLLQVIRPGRNGRGPEETHAATMLYIVTPIDTCKEVILDKKSNPPHGNISALYALQQDDFQNCSRSKPQRGFIHGNQRPFDLRDNSFHLNNAIANSFIQQPYFCENERTNIFNVSSIDELWCYMNKRFIVTLQEHPFWGKIGSESETYLLRPPRVRQVRVVEEDCIVPVAARGCFGEFSSETEDKSSFNFANDSSWVYNSPEEMGNIWFRGLVSYYNSAGYYFSLTDADQLSYYEENNWIDEQTRAIFIDFTVYNININLFCVCQILFELPPSGGITPSYLFSTVKLIRYNDEYDHRILACEILFAVFCIYYSIEIIYDGTYFKLNFFTTLDNWIDILNLALSWSSVWVLISRYVACLSILQSNALKGMQELPDYQNLKYIHLTADRVTAVTLFCSCFKFYRFLHFDTIQYIYTTIMHCLKDMASFAFLFFIILFAYAQVGTLLFGTFAESYRSIEESSFTLLRIMMGEFHYQEITKILSLIGPIYIVSFVMFVVFLLLNMFLAIINATYSVVSSNVKVTRKSEYFPFLRHCLYRMSSKFEPKPPTKQKVANNSEKVTELLKRSGFSELEIDTFYSRYTVDNDRDIPDYVFQRVVHQHVGMQHFRKLKFRTQTINNSVLQTMRKKELFLDQVGKLMRA
ncbi:Polycystin-2 [Frankliniella fusca]|uniref:Polycystin-2 n=1 Tax=Frankliniella fusca TaxID=407009 RepID=A0AAE1L682_9NEOP|nr:Polycystin-2 [Frankliniella fusca]